MKKKKRCLVYECESSPKHGGSLCSQHDATHEVVMVECSGEAHSNPFIDHCMVCMPNWGSYPTAKPKEIVK